ncbi:MAG: hypothetical protein O9312_03105 [Hylemonella sp.]|nr:hypothetical protein [Hylemonella sp.]
MTTSDTPKDGDFASYLEAKSRNQSTISPAQGGELNIQADVPVAAPPRQTIQQVLVDGEEPSDEFLEEWNALGNAPELSDEELESQALSAPGDDGDTRTPE